MEWALEQSLKSNLPVVASMAVNIEGDADGVSVQECGVRMARAGASVGKIYRLFYFNFLTIKLLLFTNMLVYKIHCFVSIFSGI